MIKEKIKHVFFDLDNTLWDHRGNSEIILKEMFKEYEIEQKHPIKFDDWHEVFYEVNEYLWANLREGKITKEELRDRRFREPFEILKVKDDTLSKAFEDIYLQRMGQMTGTVEGAEDLLKYLFDKYAIHIITNGFIEVSEDKLINSNLKKYINTLTCADEIGVRKPDPRIFTLAMQKAGAEKGNSVIIGDDWIADIIGGIGFGWHAIFLDALDDGNKLDGVATVKKLEEIKDLL